MNRSEVRPIVHFSAGAVGGSIGVVLTSPLEVIKTRLQSSVLSYKALKAGPSHAPSPSLSLVKICRETIKHEGYSSMFRGLTPSLVAVIPSKAVFFTANAKCRTIISKHFTQQSHYVNLLAGTLAGIINAFAMSPLWVIKTKLQLDHRVCNRLNVVRSSLQIWKQEGLKGFFRGSSASLAGSYEHGIYFLIYEELKSQNTVFLMFNKEYRERSPLLPTACQLAVSACAAKMLSNTAIYPTEVVRTRLRQDADEHSGKRKYRKFWQTLRTIYTEEGIVGLYGGWTLQLLKTIPFTTITFLVYEGVLYRFNEDNKHQFASKVNHPPPIPLKLDYDNSQYARHPGEENSDE